MNKVLLLDTNVSSAPIHQYLTGAGYDVHVVGRNPDDFLAKATSNYINLDYSDVDATLALVERLDAQYIVPGCNDLSYQTCAEISSRRPFPGVDSVAATHTLMNKQAFRRYAAQNDIPAPRGIAEGELVPGRPVIVKPADAYSGRGVTALKAPSPQEITAAISLAKQYSQSGAYIVEEFVEGQLYSHTAFVSDHGIVADFIVEEYGSINPFTVDTSRVVFDFNPGLLQQIRTSIEQIARDLKLNAGLIHTQFITDGDKFWIIEITRRCPGDLYSILISLSTGFSYAENYARPFIGQPFHGFAQQQNAVMRHTISLREEMPFGSLRFHLPIKIEKFVPLATAGDRIGPSSFGRIGILFVRTQTVPELDELMRTTLDGKLYAVLG